MTMSIPLVDLSAQHRSIQEEIDAALNRVVTESAFIGVTSNRFVHAFEREFAEFVGAKECVACGNGTDSLEILLKAAGIGPGDEVLVPAVSWISTSEAVTNCGATPVFVDILPGVYSMNPAAAAAQVTARTKAIIPVHLYGLPALMDEILMLAERRGLFVLEDCAQAHAATYRGKQVGTIGHAASFSFFPSKNLGAWGDAGAMLTNDPQLARRARMIAQHGQAAAKHDHQIEGRNSRMDGLQAAILSVKLKHLEAWTNTRRALAERYRSQLMGIVQGMQRTHDGAEHVYHLFVIEVCARDEMQMALQADGVVAAVQYPRPLPLLPAYARYGRCAEEFPIAVALCQRCLSLPMYPELTDAQQTFVIDAVRRVAVPASESVPR